MDKGKTALDLDREKMMDDVEYRYITDFVMRSAPHQVIKVLFGLHKETNDLKEKINKLNTETGGLPMYLIAKFDGDNYD